MHTLTADWYLPMNVNIAPFNNLKARQAVNYAIDKNAAVKLYGGTQLAHADLHDPAPELPRSRADAALQQGQRARPTPVRTSPRPRPS